MRVKGKMWWQVRSKTITLRIKTNSNSPNITIAKRMKINNIMFLHQSNYPMISLPIRSHRRPKWNTRCNLILSQERRKSKKLKLFIKTKLENKMTPIPIMKCRLSNKSTTMRQENRKFSKLTLKRMKHKKGKRKGIDSKR